MATGRARLLWPRQRHCAWTVEFWLDRASLAAVPALAKVGIASFCEDEPGSSSWPTSCNSDSQGRPVGTPIVRRLVQDELVELFNGTGLISRLTGRILTVLVAIKRRTHFGRPFATSVVDLWDLHVHFWYLAFLHQRPLLFSPPFPGSYSHTPISDTRLPSASPEPVHNPIRAKLSLEYHPYVDRSLHRGTLFRHRPLTPRLASLWDTQLR